LTSEGLREVDLSIKVPIIGLIVNPIAEIDGSVDLKGRLELSLERSIVTWGHSAASECSIRTLNAMKRNLPRVRVFPCPGEMGEKEAIAAAIGYEVMHIPLKEKTTAADTRKAARKLEGKVSLFLFIPQRIRGVCSQAASGTDYHPIGSIRIRHDTMYSYYGSPTFYNTLKVV